MGAPDGGNATRRLCSPAPKLVENRGHCNSRRSPNSKTLHNHTFGLNWGPSAASESRTRTTGKLSRPSSSGFTNAFGQVTTSLSTMTKGKVPVACPGGRRKQHSDTQTSLSLGWDRQVGPLGARPPVHDLFVSYLLTTWSGESW